MSVGLCLNHVDCHSGYQTRDSRPMRADRLWQVSRATYHGGGSDDSVTVEQRMAVSLAAIVVYPLLFHLHPYQRDLREYVNKAIEVVEPPEASQ